ncbi:MAG: PadR family transcriptional regulator [Gemmatimonadales bacterium]|nr:PadR family transcriptional regulator [Gemmatimonadales bacterium]
MSRDPLNLLQGTVDLLVLKALTWGPQHGYAVSRWIRKRSEGALGLEEAGLYQALHRLDRKGWVSATWGLSENNRRARFYELTAEGRQQLRTESGTWRQYAAAVFRILDARQAEGSS